VFIAASQEKRHVEERAAMHGYTVKDALMREVPTLKATQTLREAVEALLGSQVRSFLIVDPLQNLVGSLSREQIIEALNEGRGPDTPLTHVMDEDLLTVSPDLPLHEGFRLLQEEHKPFLVVKEGDRLLGIVDAENVEEFLLVRQALAEAFSE
jgi:CBS domain-containing protein